MKIEHIALNIPNPVQAAEWYITNLGLKLEKAGHAPQSTHFLKDDAGLMFELYNNPLAEHLNLGGLDASTFHIAFVSTDLDADTARLVAEGAQPIGPARTTDHGDRLIFLRDPFGLTVQLVHRQNGAS